MAALERLHKAKLRGFSLVENLIAIVLVLLVFIGASTAFVTFSLVPKYSKEFRAQTLIELDYKSLKINQAQAYTYVKQTEGFELSRKIELAHPSLLKVNYRLTQMDQLVLEKNYYLLKK